MSDWFLKRPDAIVQPIQGKIVIGRGEEWNVSDKRVSRNHITISLDEFGMEVTTVGANPITIYPKLVQDVLILRTGESYHLQDGDRFCLVPGQEQAFAVLRNYKGPTNVKIAQSSVKKSNRMEVEPAPSTEPKQSFADIKRKALESLGEKHQPATKKRKVTDDENADEDAIGNFEVDQLQKQQYKGDVGNNKPQQQKPKQPASNNADLNPWKSKSAPKTNSNNNSSNSNNTNSAGKSKQNKLPLLASPSDVGYDDEFDLDYEPQDHQSMDEDETERKGKPKAKSNNKASAASLNPWKTQPATNITKSSNPANDSDSDDGDSRASVKKSSGGGGSLNPWNDQAQKGAKKKKATLVDELSEEDSMDDFVVGGKKKKKEPANAKTKANKKTATKFASNYSGKVDSNYKWNTLAGKIIAITGTLSRKRADIIELIQDNGGVFHAAVTRNVTHLIAADPHNLTNKLEKAKNAGTKIVSEESLLGGLKKRSEAGGNPFLDDDDDVDDGFVVDKKKKSKKYEDSDQNEDNENVGGGGEDENENEENEEEKVAPEPLTEIEDGGAYTVPGSNYEIRFRGGVYYCTCVAWKMQNLPVDVRTCKHMRQVLGNEFETWRTGREGNKAAKVEKTNAPNVLLANAWDEAKTDPKGYWMSEKLDGVRAYWNGKLFVSRNGNKFYAPDYFIKDLPSDWELDGELFTKRGEFNTTVSIVKSQDQGQRWKQLKYCIFDVPTFKDKPFEERMKLLKEKFPEEEADKAIEKKEYAIIVKQVLCKGKDHLMEQLAKVEAKKGEGLMLREARSQYVGKRSNTLLKVKTFSDCEAKVVGHIPGKGKFVGLLGALQCELASGIKFQVGSGFSEKERGKPPPIGSIVTVKYQELTPGGVPRFPSYIGIRIDAVWPPKK